MRIRRGNRGALEGLPLYLIILVVIAALVLIIVVGWLQFFNKPSLGSISYYVDGNQNAINQTDATFTLGSPNAGECLVQVSGAVALEVTATGTDSKPLSNVIVKVAGGTGVLNISASPDLQMTTGSNGQVQFTGLSFDLAGGSDTGIITLQVSYNGGIASGVSNPQISVSAPSADNC